MSDFNLTAQFPGAYDNQEQVSNSYDGLTTDDGFSDVDLQNIGWETTSQAPMNQLYDTGAMQYDQVPMQMPNAMSMQQQQVLMPTTTPATMPQRLWHPDHGYYYPAPPPPGMPTMDMSNMPPQQQMMASGTPQEGYIPIQPPQMGPQQVGGFYGFAPQPIHPMQQSVARLERTANTKTKQTRGQKRGWTIGSQSFLEDNHGEDPAPRPRKRARGTKRPAPPADDDDGDEDYVDGSGPSRKDRLKPGSIYQTCVCNFPSAAEKQEHIKRPRNAFMIYRTQNHKQIARQYKTYSKNGGILNTNVSRIAGDLWRAESPEVRARYHEYARLETEQHRRDHPDYVYRPRKKGGDMRDDPNFGRPGCTCGAYLKNMAKYKGLPIPGEREPIYVSDSPEDQMAATSTNGSGAPEAPPMFAPQQQQATGWNEDAELASLRAQVDTYAQQQQQQQRQQSFNFDFNAVDPASLRRRSSTRSGLAYGATDVLEELFPNARPPAAPIAAEPEVERTRRRPSPISTPYSSPPAHNRRSRRQSSLGLGELNSTVDLSEFDDMMQDEFFADFIQPSRRNSSISGGRRASGARLSLGESARRVSSTKDESPPKTLRRSPRHAGTSAESAAGAPRRSARLSG